MGGLLFFFKVWEEGLIAPFILKVDFEYNGVIQSDRQETRAESLENPTGPLTCDVSDR